jgi:predicted Zn-dependent peptidase
MIVSALVLASLLAGCAGTAPMAEPETRTGGRVPQVLSQRPEDLEYPPIELTTPEYERVEFANGMHGFFIEDHEVPIVDMTILIPTDFPPEGKEGLATLTAEVMRDGGSEAWPGSRINEELEFVAASVEVDAVTRSINVHVNCLKKDLDLCLDVLGELLARPAFPEDVFELRRETMIEDQRRENDEPRYIARREYQEALYAGHPYSRHASIESASSLTRDDLVGYYEAYVAPDNAIVGIVGDVTKDEIMGRLEEALADWSGDPAPIEPVPEMDADVEPTVNYAYKDLNQAVIMIGHLGVNSRNEDLPAIRIMNFILGGGSFTSRITQKVRTDEGLAYAAYSQYGDDPWAYGLFTASSQTRADAAGRAAGLIIDIIEEMREGGPTEEEFERARDTYLNQQVFQYESKAELIGRLVRYEHQGLPLDRAERMIEAMENMTVEDVRMAAREYLHPDRLTMVFVGDQEQFDTPLATFGTVHEIELK